MRIASRAVDFFSPHPRQSLHSERLNAAGGWIGGRDKRERHENSVLCFAWRARYAKNGKCACRFARDLRVPGVPLCRATELEPRRKRGKPGRLRGYHQVGSGARARYGMVSIELRAEAAPAKRQGVPVGDKCRINRLQAEADGFARLLLLRGPHGRGRIGGVQQFSSRRTAFCSPRFGCRVYDPNCMQGLSGSVQERAIAADRTRPLVAACGRHKCFLSWNQRCHRDAQSHPVFCRRFVARGSPSERCSGWESCCSARRRLQHLPKGVKA